MQELRKGLQQLQPACLHGHVPSSAIGWCYSAAKALVLAGTMIAGEKGAR